MYRLEALGDPNSIYSVAKKRGDVNAFTVSYRKLEEEGQIKIRKILDQNLGHVNEKRKSMFLCSVMEVRTT